MVNIYTLVNGEQIIGVNNPSYIDRPSGFTHIENPFYIMESQDEHGNNGMKLINVCTFSDQQYIVVDDKHIVFSIPANDSMSRYYEKLVVANQDIDTTKMIESAIKEMEDMEESMRNIISQRLVGGSTIN